MTWDPPSTRNRDPHRATRYVANAIGVVIMIGVTLIALAFFAAIIAWLLRFTF